MDGPDEFGPQHLSIRGSAGRPMVTPHQPLDAPDNRLPIRVGNIQISKGLRVSNSVPNPYRLDKTAPSIHCFWLQLNIPNFGQRAQAKKNTIPKRRSQWL